MKRLVNVRIDADLLASFDEWARLQGWSRTRAIERCMASVTASPPPQRPDPVMPEGRKPWNPSAKRGEVTPRFKGG